MIAAAMFSITLAASHSAAIAKKNARGAEFKVSFDSALQRKALNLHRDRKRQQSRSAFNSVAP
jgi:hypothetical protein